MSLAEAQRWMHDALVFPRGAEIGERLVGDGRLGAVDGLAVYQRGYFLRIVACMREQFPALCHALGRALFDDFVADYIRDLPSDSHTLYDLGRRFSGWMAANRPDADAPEAWIDFMIDLARFEYAVFEMFDVEGNEGRSFAGMDTLDADLRLQPAFALGAYGFPVAEYYHAVRRGDAAELPGARASYVALVRVGYVIHTVPISETHHAFLAELAVGGSVEAALAEVSARFGLDADEAHRSWRAPGGSRARWIEAGFFARAGAA